MTSFQKRNTVQYSKSRLKLTFDDDFGGRTIASMIPAVHTYYYPTSNKHHKAQSSNLDQHIRSNSLFIIRYYSVLNIELSRIIHNIEANAL